MARSIQVCYLRKNFTEIRSLNYERKTLLIVIFLLIYLNPAYSQEDDVQRFNQTRNHINKIAMITLGSWAFGNIAVNSAIYQQGEMASV